MRLLDIVSLFILGVLTVGALFLVLIVAAIPGKLAKKRHSPWVEAINVAELIGVLLLLGRYPSVELKTTSALATSPPPVPAGLPLQLLERRPDVVAAEHSFNAAFHLVQTAETARLPSISLTGAGGYATNALLQYLRCEPWTRKLAGQLLAPIYTGGYLQAQVQIAD